VKRCACKRPELRVTALVAIDMPFALYRRVTKTRLRRRDVRIEAVHWDRAIIHCVKCRKYLVTP
jgi:hypothetical protein